MKKQMLVVLSFVLLAGLGTAFSQASTEARFNIPFEFVVNDVTLPAGDYIVDYSARTSYLTVRNVDGRATAIVLTKPASGKAISAQYVLVFNRYGKKNFLSEMYSADNAIGRGIPKSAYEREVTAGLKVRSVQLAAK